MHLAPLLHDLAIILAVAGLVSIVFQKLRQPIVLGYIIAGMIVGPFTPPRPLVTDLPSIRTWADLGVIFLMFSLGLDFSFRKLARVGLSAGITAVLEVALTLVLGYVTGRALGWSNMNSLFLGAMISISSTTIVVKALDELKLRTRRFAEMILAVLIVEDLIAVLLLVAISTMAASGKISGLALLTAAAKLVLVVSAWFLTGYFIIPRFIRYVGRVGSNEMLTIVALALCLSLVGFAAYLNYSVALGAFIMGSILAESTESQRIEELMEPLRDLFVAVFFVSVGMLIDPRLLWQYKFAILAISLVTLAGKIVFTTFGALVTGQTLRTSVQVGFGMAQIGEFSFIIASLGLALRATDSFLYPVAVAVSLITTFTAPYRIRVSHRFAVWLEGKLPVRLKSAMSQYVTWARERSADAARRKEFYKLLFRWIMNGVLVTVVFILVAEVVLPAFGVTARASYLTAGLGWFLSVILSSPFIWAMLSAFSKFRINDFSENQPPRGGTLLIMRLLSLIWIGALSLEFFRARTVLLAIVGMAALLFFAFYRQIESSYHWFEKRFLSTFDFKEKTKAPTDVLRRLVPWDAHLVRIKVHPNSDFVLKKVAELRLRSSYGINIVVIQRGLKTIVAPRSEEVILPKDELLVLGVDEQIEKVRPIIEKPPGLADRFRPIAGYELYRILVEPMSGLAGKTLKDSGISEEFGAIIVGIERFGNRIINPTGDLIFSAEDVLWVVGEKEQLDRLVQLCTSRSPAQ